MIERSFMSWSGGKDSALALHKAQQEGRAVQALLTSVNKTLNRISMHGVRRELLQLQSASLCLPLYSIELPEMPDMQRYEEEVRRVHLQLKNEGFTHGIFGDIFLEDLKHYREELLAKDRLQGLFPIWRMESREVIKEFLQSGFKAIVVCTDNSKLDKSYCGRLMDELFFNELPETIDPCGENGEYHSFVFDGPNFKSPIAFAKGELVLKEYPSPKSTDCFSQPKPSSGFYFCDLLPV